MKRVMSKTVYLPLVLVIFMINTNLSFAAEYVASFDTFTTGSFITSQLKYSHGADFPSAVEVFDPESMPGTRGIRPELLDEFRRKRIVIDFAVPMTSVSLQVGNIAPRTISGVPDQIVTIKAYAIVDLFFSPAGIPIPTLVIVDSDNVHIGGSDRTSRPTLHVRDDTYGGIYQVVVESGPAGSSPDNLHLFADWLVMETREPLPQPPLPDRAAPTVEILDPVNGEVLSSTSFDYRVTVTEDRELATVWHVISNSVTGATLEADLCGTPVSGSCPASELHRTISVELGEEGTYQLTVFGCDVSGNCSDASILFTVRLPVISPPVSVIPWKLEVNQGMQSSLSDVSMPGAFNSTSFSQAIVPGKDAIVRWYLLGREGSRPDFTARMQVLVIYRDGTDKSFTISPNAGASTITVPADPGGLLDRYNMFIGTMRANLSQTLNFVIPGTDLVNATAMQLNLQTVSGVTRIPFGAPIILGLNIYRVRGGYTGVAPTDTQIDNAIMPYLRDALPVSDIRILTRSNFSWGGPYAFSGDCSSLLFDVWWAYGGDDTRSYLRGPGSFTTNLAVATTLRACNGIGYVGDPSDSDYRYGNVAVTRLFGDVAAHEIGHNIGLLHMSNNHGEGGGGDTEPGFYPHGLVGPSDFGLIPNNITPPGAFDRGQWSPVLVDPCPFAVAPDLSDRLPSCSMVDGNGDGSLDDWTRAHDLMSYGASPTNLSPLITSRNQRWTSATTYGRFYSAILSGIVSPAITMALPVSSDAVLETKIEALLIGGVVQKDGSIRLMPLMRKLVPLSMVKVYVTGRYVLQFFKSDGTLLKEHYFDPVKAGDTDEVLIRLVIPYAEAAGMSRLVILENGQNGQHVVAEVKASPSSPKVTIIEPNGGEVFLSGVHKIRWEASDPDGDALTFLVQYTPDGGLSWQGIDFVRTQKAMEAQFDVNELIPGQQAMIRVTASDGINTAVDVSDSTFTVGLGDPDIDGDGVPNEKDLCGSTPPGVVVDPSNGCSIDQLSPCKGPWRTTSSWKNHGEYVSSVTKTAQRFLKQGLITQAQKAAIVAAAANSKCGKKE